MNRELVQADGTYALREPSEAYTGEYTGENDALAPQSTIPWDKMLELFLNHSGATLTFGLPLQRQPCIQAFPWRESSRNRRCFHQR